MWKSSTVTQDSPVWYPKLRDTLYNLLPRPWKSSPYIWICPVLMELNYGLLSGYGFLYWSIYWFDVYHHLAAVKNGALLEKVFPWGYLGV